ETPLRMTSAETTSAMKCPRCMRRDPFSRHREVSAGASIALKQRYERGGAPVPGPSLGGRAVRTLREPATQLGKLRRREPLSESFGFDRGLPINRVYIERFLRAEK